MNYRGFCPWSLSTELHCNERINSLSLFATKWLSTNSQLVHSAKALRRLYVVED